MPQTLRLPRRCAPRNDTKIETFLFRKRTFFIFCGYFLRGAALHLFSNVSFRKLFRFPAKPISLVIARRARAPDAAILNGTIFIMFLPHLGACFALLPCRSSVFSKKCCFLKKTLDKSGKPRYNKRALRRYGRLAQLARASA